MAIQRTSWSSCNIWFSTTSTSLRNISWRPLWHISSAARRKRKWSKIPPSLISSVWCVKSNLLAWQVWIDTKPRKDTMPVKLQLSLVAVNHQRNGDERPNNAPSTKWCVSNKIKLILRMTLKAMKERPALLLIVELTLSITLRLIGLVVNRVIDGTTQFASILLINLKAN